jgi:recombination protein RecA
MAGSTRKARGLDDASKPAEAKAGAPSAKGKAAKKPPSKRKAAKGKGKATRTAPPKAKDYVKALKAMKGVDEGDFAIFDDPLAWVATVEEWLPTGSLAVDRLLGGGYPLGRIVEVAAWEGVGKSTLLDQSIAMTQRLGGVACLIDTEQARDERYMHALGVDTTQLIVRSQSNEGMPLTMEDTFESIERMLSLQEQFIKDAKGSTEVPPMLIVWDSVAGTPSRHEAKGNAGDAAKPGDAASTMRSSFRRIAQRVARARTCLVFANQFYQSIGGPFSTLNTYGGGGVKYYASVRLWLTRKGSLKKGDEAIGHIIEAKLKKTRVNRPRPPAELGLIYGAGIHNAYTLFEWGKTAGVSPVHKWVTTRGSWSYVMIPEALRLPKDDPDYKEYEAFQGTYMGFAEILSQNPVVYQAMALQYADEGKVDG